MGNEDWQKSQKGNKILLLLSKILFLSVRLPLIVFITLLLIAAGLSVFGISRYPEVIGIIEPQMRLQREAEELISEVGKLMALPSDERPTIATVTDIEKIKDQPFFRNARNGDKVLIYTNARRAILYRPEEKRIIEVGALNIKQQEQNENQEENQQSEGTPEEGTLAPTVEPTDTPTPTATPTPEEEVTPTPES